MTTLTSKYIYDRLSSGNYPLGEFKSLAGNFDLVKKVVVRFIKEGNLNGSAHKLLLTNVKQTLSMFENNKWTPLNIQPLAYVYYDLIHKYPDSPWKEVLSDSPDILKYYILNLHIYDHGAKDLDLVLSSSDSGLSLLVYFAKYEFEKGIKGHPYYKAAMPDMSDMGRTHLDNSLPTVIPGIKQVTSLWLDWSKDKKKSHAVESLLWILEQLESEFNVCVDARLCIINEFRELIKEQWPHLSSLQRMTAIFVDNAYFNSAYSDDWHDQYVAEKHIDLSGVYYRTNQTKQFENSIDYLKHHYGKLLDPEFLNNMLLQKTLLDIDYLPLHDLRLMYENLNIVPEELPPLDCNYC